MHPAPSIIFFTVTAGAGYGLLLVFALFLLAGVVSPEGSAGIASLVLALGLITLGLVSSTLHLRHRERAWRALSQWRSSWLSREGVLAAATYVPALVLLIALWAGPGLRPVGSIAAYLSLVGAVAVVFSTSMIYYSLRPIAQWHHPLVPPLYLLFAVKTGLLLLLVVTVIFGGEIFTMWAAALVAVLAAWLVKLGYWHLVDRASPRSTPSSATGLEGRVSVLDPPHTEDNYLLTEMGYRVARKHAARLRRIAVAAGAGLPVLALLPGFFVGGPTRMGLAIVAAVSALVATLIERWLFFAEARHTVTLYYGKELAPANS